MGVALVIHFNTDFPFQANQLGVCPLSKPPARPHWLPRHLEDPEWADLNCKHDMEN
jgi:hypothetical protein